MDECKILLIKDKEVSMTINEAYEQYKRMLHTFIRPWANKYDYDDLYQVASVGLMKTYKAYDRSKNVQFTSLLGTIVNNELLMYNRKNKKHSNILSLSSLLNIDNDGNELTVLDALSDDIDYAENTLNKIQVEEIKLVISKLKDREKEIIESYYLNGMNQRQLAEKLNISQSYICRIIDRTLLKIKKLYDCKEIHKNEKVRGATDKMKGKINRDILIAEAKVLGTNKKAQKIIAEKYGMAEITIERYMSTWGIRKEVNRVKDETKITEKDIEYLTEADIKECDQRSKEMVEEIKKNIKENAPVTARILQPVLFMGKVMEYKVSENSYALRRPNGTTTMIIGFNEVDDLIKELQELKELRNVG